MSETQKKKKKLLNTSFFQEMFSKHLGGIGEEYDSGKNLGLKHLYFFFKGYLNMKFDNKSNLKICRQNGGSNSHFAHK